MREERDSVNVVAFDRGRRRPDPARVSEFAATARKLRREREEAESIVGLLRDTPHGEWPSLADNPALRNSGVLERLGREAAASLERDPQEALALSNLATAIAETVPVDSYPPVVLAQLRAHAWKDRAQSLSYVGRYPDALEAIGRAEQLLEPFAGVAHDRAIVRLVKAMALQHVENFDESLRLLVECKAVFFDHGDSQRSLYCGIAEGVSLYRRRRFTEACDALRPLLEEARAAEDRLSQARVYNNLGHCEMELGDLDDADRHLSKAVAIFNDLDLQVEASRTELAAGRVQVEKGDLMRGLARLYEARRRFLAYGLVEEAGLCGLEITAIFLSRGENVLAAGLASEIAAEFAAASLNRRALVALAYLREAIAENDASRETADYVRGFIAGLREDPERDFVAM